jgi:hypothetical protein
MCGTITRREASLVLGSCRNRAHPGLSGEIAGLRTRNSAFEAARLAPSALRRTTTKVQKYPIRAAFDPKERDVNRVT